MSLLVVVSAGRGPVEVRTFVTLLAEALSAALGAAGFAATAAGVPATALPATAPSVTLSLPDAARPALAAWLGSHVLVAPLRGKGARRRWYAEVRLFDAPAATPFDPTAVRWTAARAGGPGGQNVNRRATAVRAVDPGTGLTVRVAEHRHQGRNARVAVTRLAEQISAHDATTHAHAAAERRATHDDVRRRPPDHTWTLDPRGRLHRDAERQPG